MEWESEENMGKDYCLPEKNNSPVKLISTAAWRNGYEFGQDKIIDQVTPIFNKLLADNKELKEIKHDKKDMQNKLLLRLSRAYEVQDKLRAHLQLWKDTEPGAENYRNKLEAENNTLKDLGVKDNITILKLVTENKKILNEVEFKRFRVNELQSKLKEYEEKIKHLDSYIDKLLHNVEKT